jgi:hypothetical protein
LLQDIHLGSQGKIKSHKNIENSYYTVPIFVICNDCATKILPVFYAAENLSFLTLREKLALGATEQDAEKAIST